jgi:hypothetical protein
MNYNITNNQRNFGRKVFFITLFMVSLFIFSGCNEKINPEPPIIPPNAGLGIAEQNTDKLETNNVNAASTINTPKVPSKVLIYYSWPSVVNGANGNVNVAIAEFSKFDIIVLGDGLQKPSHGDNAKTKQIIAGLTSKGKKVFGYVDVGVKTQNLNEVQLKTAIDQWASMGVTGVFGDDFGTDYGVYRARQNVFIDYAHLKKLSVFANAWSVNDALGGIDCRLDSRDFYLLESYGYGHGLYRPLSETIENRGKVAYYYMKLKGVGIVAVATTKTTGLNAASNTSEPFLHSYYATLMYNFTGFGFTDEFYSASGANANKAISFSFPLTSYGTSFIQQDFVEKKNNLLYLRSTNTHHLYLNDKTGYAVKR